MFFSNSAEKTIINYLVINSGLLLQVLFLSLLKYMLATLCFYYLYLLKKYATTIGVYGLNPK